MSQNSDHPITLQRSDYIVALLNAIPYAGGTIASLVDARATNIRFRKIADAIEELSNSVNRRGIDVQQILNEEEAIEILEKTITEIGRTANEEKLRLLKNLLVRSCCDSNMAFDEKEFYLSVLSSLSIWELKILHFMYINGDPFVITVNPYSDFQTQRFSRTVTTGFEQYEIGYREGSESLRSKLSTHFGENNLVNVLGSIALLDSKGLTAIGANLDRTTNKIQTVTRDASMILSGGMSNSLYANAAHRSEPQNTPFEASKTEFGEKFVSGVSTM